jgi:hypothetical protein
LRISKQKDLSIALATLAIHCDHPNLNYVVVRTLMMQPLRDVILKTDSSCCDGKTKDASQYAFLNTTHSSPQPIILILLRRPIER